MLCSVLSFLQYGIVMGLIVLLAIGGAIAGYIRRDDVCCVCVCVSCVCVCVCVCRVYACMCVRQQYP